MRKYRPTPGMVRALRNVRDRGDPFPNLPGSAAVAGGQTTVLYALCRRGYLTWATTNEPWKLTAYGKAFLEELDHASR